MYATLISFYINFNGKNSVISKFKKVKFILKAKSHSFDIIFKTRNTLPQIVK